jgi:sugar phosphate isomerase/epimerase
MQLGIFAKTFAGRDPGSVFRAARAAGYRAVQYNMACSGLPPMPVEIPPGTADAICAAARQTGVAVAAISATYNMIHPDCAVRRRGHASLACIAAVAREIGAPLLTLCTGTRDPADQWRAHPDNQTPQAWRDLLVSIETAVEIAERYGVALGIEPEPANVVHSADLARRLMIEIGSPRLRIVLDPANLFAVESLDRQRAIVADAIEKLADRLSLVHAKDRDAAGRVVTAGTGVLDYRFYFRRLRDARYTGPVITHGLHAEEAADVAAFLERRLAELSPV